MSAALFASLQATLSDDSKHLFACGGTITANEDCGSPAATLRWDDKAADSGKKISFPVASVNDLQNLISDCEPASFGLGDKDVLDASYRKAGKMDTQRFCTDLDIASLGTLDRISHFLFPCAEDEGTSDLRSELYKLNSAPSGMFKPHVDAPRGSSHVGTLVLYLPSEHEGGQLVVRHSDKAVTFDWSDKCPRSIQWAAFYSSCEHEVLEVTSGNRVTLTYNLFVDDAIDDKPSFKTSTTSTLPLSDDLKIIFDDRKLLPTGGTIGFHLNHRYVHHNGVTALERFGGTLKGIDAYCGCER